MVDKPGAHEYLYYDMGVSSTNLSGLLLALSLILTAPLSSEPSATTIIKEMERQTQGTTSAIRMEIVVQRPRFTRSMLLDSWGDTDRKFSFIRLLKPKKDRGIAFLKRGNELWQYIPRIGREIKIEGSLMHDSWMGSDFTNDDLVRASSLQSDYKHELLKPPADNLYRLKLTPLPSATVAWGSVIIDVRKKDYLPVLQEFYDHRQRLTKVMEFFDYRNLGGRLIPSKMVMYTIRNQKKISSTTLYYRKAVFNLKIPDHIFSKSNLRR